MADLEEKMLQTLKTTTTTTAITKQKQKNNDLEEVHR